MKDNILLHTDVYKFGHMIQYQEGCTKVYSYLTARSDKKFKNVVFFGLQYYLQKYLSKPISPWMGEQFLEYSEKIVGPNSEDVKQKIRSLCKLGYWPIEIKAVEEGTVLPVKNALMTITNTLPEFYWAVGFVESLLLKVWYTCTVATQCYEYRKLVEKFFNETVDEDKHFLKDFTVHDFGYRGDSSEDGAGISGVAHLISFLGSDTVLALPTALHYYNAEYPVMLSVPASEHSVMCSYGKDNEIDAFKRMLELYPTGIVSIVSDTFDVYKVLTTFCEELKEKILSRDGTTVFRPDSGNPEYIICGDPNAEIGSNEHKGCIQLLDEKFGHSINNKGYKVLNPKVNLIYGDGMYFERYETILKRMKEMGWAASNLVIGVGGILRNHTRDTLGFAIKATYVEVNGESRDIEKDPVTDKGKKSAKGLLKLTFDDYFQKYYTKDQCSQEEEKEGELKTVFKDGKLKNRTNLSKARKNVSSSLKG